MSTMRYVRLYTGTDQISHFEDVDVDLKASAAGVEISELLTLTALNFRKTSATEYNVDFHPAPRRQFVVNLSGMVEIEASDGETRRFGPGTIMLAEDTTGKGHKSRGIGPDDRISLFLHLPVA